MNLVNAIRQYALGKRSSLLPLEARLSRRLALIHATALVTGMLVVSILITFINYRIDQSNLKSSQALLINTLRTQLSYFEFATTADNLLQFNEIINAERMVLFDRYDMIRAETGDSSPARPSDEKIEIIDESGIMVGSLEIWHRPNWPFQDLNIVWLLSMGIILLLSLGLLRTAFSRVLQEEVIAPLRQVITFIKDSPTQTQKNEETLEKLKPHSEFQSIVETYRQVYQTLRAESHQRETQYNLVDQALFEAGISLTYHDQWSGEHSATIGAVPPSEIAIAMTDANNNARSLKDAVENNCTNYEEITRVHPHSQEEIQITYQVKTAGEREEYWLLIDVPFKNGVAVLGKDITHTHKAELELRRAQKMEALGVLASGVAHDFNNLLSIVVTSLEMIQMTKTSDKDIQELVNQSLAALSRASTVAKNLLAYGRESKTRKVRVAPEELLNSLKIMIQTGERSAISYEFQKQSDLELNLDRDLLESALLNLMINSGHAMNQKGRVIVSYRKASEEERVRISPAMRENVVTIEVRDFGTGIPADQIEKVCDPFFTTKRGNQGSGLGLSMVSGFAKQFDGAFIIENRRRGVSAKIILPANLAVLGAEVAPKEPEEYRPVEGMVLVVDDNVNLLSAIEKSMQLRGHQCKTATSCSEAKKIIQKMELPIEVLVTDLNLTDGDGYEVFRAYKNRHKNGRVILISGNAEKAFSDDNFDYVLQKPFSLKELFLAVEGATNQNIQKWAVC